MSDNVNVRDIRTILTLERVEKNIFRGPSQDIGTPQVYGGQVLGQAIAAAQLTVEEDRPVHSAHAYFLRKGDFNAPIVYEVDRSREGRTFTARRVVAIQHGKPIFTLAASFQAPEEGYEYQAPQVLPDFGAALPLSEKERDPSRKDSIVRPINYFDVRVNPEPDPEDPNALAFWVKTRQALPDAADIHREVLAYVSDYGLLFSALVPHGYSMISSKGRSISELALASIDHAIWFHRPFRVDEWLYYRCVPISTAGSRGLARGSVIDGQGRLVATTIQEGLMRKVSG
ncbi:acyl-CoA thioesterase II [Granulosicoccaceae sp. 1_MG-2023]|nr:acyl-CoA thioesterase II [Granulosicoccaceae sp. 1_MG-2023]